MCIRNQRLRILGEGVGQTALALAGLGALSNVDKGRTARVIDKGISKLKNTSINTNATARRQISGDIRAKINKIKSKFQDLNPNSDKKWFVKVEFKIYDSFEPNANFELKEIELSSPVIAKNSNEAKEKAEEQVMLGVKQKNKNAQKKIKRLEVKLKELENLQGDSVKKKLQDEIDSLKKGLKKYVFNRLVSIKRFNSGSFEITYYDRNGNEGKLKVQANTVEEALRTFRQKYSSKGLIPIENSVMMVEELNMNLVEKLKSLHESVNNKQVNDVVDMFKIIKKIDITKSNTFDVVVLGVKKHNSNLTKRRAMLDSFSSSFKTKSQAEDFKIALEERIQELEQNKYPDNIDHSYYDGSIYESKDSMTPVEEINLAAHLYNKFISIDVLSIKGNRITIKGTYRLTNKVETRTYQITDINLAKKVFKSLSMVYKDDKIRNNIESQVKELSESAAGVDAFSYDSLPPEIQEIIENNAEKILTATKSLLTDNIEVNSSIPTFDDLFRKEDNVELSLELFIELFESVQLLIKLINKGIGAKVPNTEVVCDLKAYLELKALFKNIIVQNIKDFNSNKEAQKVFTDRYNLELKDWSNSIKDLLSLEKDFNQDTKLSIMYDALVKFYNYLVDYVKLIANDYEYDFSDVELDLARFLNLPFDEKILDLKYLNNLLMYC